VDFTYILPMWIFFFFYPNQKAEGAIRMITIEMNFLACSISTIFFILFDGLAIYVNKSVCFYLLKKKGIRNILLNDEFFLNEVMKWVKCGITLILLT
jgi:hypothetical protein